MAKEQPDNKQGGGNGDNRIAPPETSNDGGSEFSTSEQARSIQIPETKQAGFIIAELTGRLDNLEGQERFTTQGGQVDVVSLRNSDEFKQVLKQFLKLKHQLSEGVSAQEASAYNLSDLENKIDQILEKAWLAEIRDNQEPTWEQELANIDSLEGASQLFTTLEEKAQELYDQYFGSKATHSITEWTPEQSELLQELKFKLEAGSNLIQDIVGDLLSDQLEEGKLEEIEPVLEKLKNQVGSVDNLVVTIKQSLESGLGNNPEATVIKQTEATRLSVGRDHESTHPSTSPDEAETKLTSEIMTLEQVQELFTQAIDNPESVDQKWLLQAIMQVKGEAQTLDDLREFAKDNPDQLPIEIVDQLEQVVRKIESDLKRKQALLTQLEQALGKNHPGDLPEGAKFLDALNKMEDLQKAEHLGESLDIVGTSHEGQEKKTNVTRTTALVLLVVLDLVLFNGSVINSLESMLEVGATFAKLAGIELPEELENIVNKEGYEEEIVQAVDANDLAEFLIKLKAHELRKFFKGVKPETRRRMIRGKDYSSTTTWLSLDSKRKVLSDRARRHIYSTLRPYDLKELGMELTEEEKAELGLK